MLAKRSAEAILALGEVGCHLRPVNTHSPPPISKQDGNLQPSDMFHLAHTVVLKIRISCQRLKIQTTRKNSGLQLLFFLKI